LKKQSQFMKGQKDVMPVLTMVYRKFSGPRCLKTKPIQSQFAGDVEPAHAIPIPKG
jgi:hypothetical protein